MKKKQEEKGEKKMEQEAVVKTEEKSHKSKMLRSKASGTTEVVSEGLETKSQSEEKK